MLKQQGITRPIVLDVRQAEEIVSEPSEISGSVEIPLPELPKRVHELEHAKNRTILCLCRAGVRSTTAAAMLKGLGFSDVMNMEGGMLAWRKMQAGNQ